MLVRWLDAPAEEPTLGTVLARRYVGILGTAEELAARMIHGLREAGWERIPIGAIRGDGAPWIWHVADAHVPGVRQTLDDDHLSEHLYAFATRRYPNNPAGAKAWVEQQLGALLPDRIGEVLGALQRLRLWQKAVRKALAVGSGAVEGACTHVIQQWKTS